MHNLNWGDREGETNMMHTLIVYNRKKYRRNIRTINHRKETKRYKTGTIEVFICIKNGMLCFNKNSYRLPDWILFCWYTLFGRPWAMPNGEFTCIKDAIRIIHLAPPGTCMNYMLSCLQPWRMFFCHFRFLYSMLSFSHLSPTSSLSLP